MKQERSNEKTKKKIENNEVKFSHTLTEELLFFSNRVL